MILASFVFTAVTPGGALGKGSQGWPAILISPELTICWGEGDSDPLKT
jgi:hypothetical protein